MKKAFYLNIALLILINLLIKPLYLFGIDAEVQNQVGNSDYGTYFAIFNFLFIFQWILDPGIQNYNTQALSKDRDSLHTRLSYSLAGKCLTALVYVGVIGFSATLFFGLEYWQIIILLCTNLVLLSFVVFLRTHFSAMGFYYTDSFLSSLDKLLLIFSLGYLLYLSETEMTILLFLQLQCTTLVITLFIVGFFFVRQFGRLSYKFDISQIKSLLQDAFPYAIVFILMSLYTRMDGVMLKSLVDDKAVSAGIYAAGFRVYDALNMVGFLFASLLLPMFANLINKPDQLAELYESALRLLLVVATLISICSSLYSKEIMFFLYTDASSDHVEVFRLLSMSFYLVALTYVFGTLIAASGKLTRLNWLFVFGIPLNFILNWFLIPDQQAVGAGITTCLTQAVILIGQIVIVYRQFDFKFNFSLILRYSLLFGVIFALSVIVKDSLNWHFILEIGLIGIIAIAIILGSKFLRLDSILGAQPKAS